MITKKFYRLIIVITFAANSVTADTYNFTPHGKKAKSIMNDLVKLVLVATLSWFSQNSFADNDCDNRSNALARFGCNLKSNYDRQDELRIEAFKNKCDNFGYQRGTNEFAQCMMTLDTQETARSEARRQYYLDMTKAPSLQTTPQVNCTTTRNCQ